MFIADHRSRASVCQELPTEKLDEVPIFAMELESMNPFDSIQLSPERFAQLETCTSHDAALQKLKITVITGCPKQQEKVPVQIIEYWGYRDEISIHNGALFKNHRVIIPKLMHEEMLCRIHSSHLGIYSCLRKPKMSNFWPGMNSPIKEVVTSCQICAEFLAHNPKQLLQTHEISDRPWSCVAADLFTRRNKDYIAFVDH